MKINNIQIQINATNALVYHWRVTGEDAGASAGSQGTEQSLGKALLSAAEKMHADKVEGMAWLEYTRAKYDADYPECEGGIRATAHATVEGLYYTPEKTAGRLLADAK